MRSILLGTEVRISYGMVPSISASSETVGSSPNMVTVSPTFASTPVMSSMHMSMHMLPMVGTLCPFREKDALPLPRCLSIPSAYPTGMVAMVVPPSATLP